MKISFHNAFYGVRYIAAAAMVSLALAACGDDGPTKSENIEHGDKDVSSSSISKDDGKSSSSKKGSSSDSKNSSDSKSSSDSKNSSDSKPSSSSSVKGDQPASSSSEKVEVPEGARAATLEDLEKNMSLGEMFGTTVYMATGTKQGLFSLWIPDTAWIAVASDFSDGVLNVNKNVAAFTGVSGSTTADSMKALLDDGLKINFVVDDEVLQFSMDGGKTYKNVGSATVKLSDKRLSKGEDLKNVKLSCKNGDKKEEYSFYEGRYHVEVKSGDKVESWSAGYYDIQRSHLMMLPKFFDGQVNSMTTFWVEPETYNLSFYNTKLDCDKSALKYTAVTAKDLVNEWEATEGDYEWTFELKSSKEFDMSAVKGGSLVQSKRGLWDVYGDMLFLHATACRDTKTCTQVVKGYVGELDPKVGFEIDHNDKAEPLMPTVWTLPQYE